MDDFDLWCPSCRTPVPVELKRDLVAGKAATCESCGILIVPRFQGAAPRGDSPVKDEHVSLPPPLSPSFPPSATPPSSQHRAGTRHVDARATVSAPRVIVHGRDRGGDRRGTPGGVPSITIESSPPSSRVSDATLAPGKPRKSLSATRAARIAARVEKQEKRVATFNDISDSLIGLFCGIFFLVTALVLSLDAFVFRVPDVLRFFQNLLLVSPFLVLASFMLWYEKKRLYPWLKEGIHEFYGIDMIIVGFTCIAVFGIGLLLVIKGIMVMELMLGKDRLHPVSRRQARAAWIDGLDEVSWMIVGIAAINAFLMVPLAFTGGVLAGPVPGGAGIAGLVVGILGLVAVSADRGHVSSQVRRREYEGLAPRATVNAIIGLACLGSGIPMLVKAMLLSTMDGLGVEPVVSTSPDVPEPEPEPEGAGPGGPATPAVSPVPGRSPAPASQPAPVLRPAPVPAPRPAPAPQPAPAGRAGDETRRYLQRQFNVLTPKVRRRLRKLERLGLSREDIDDVVEELVHRPEFEQLAIIDQFVAVNDNEGIDPRHVLAVRNMDLPTEAKKWILGQLQLMNEADIDPFLEQVKRGSPAA